MLTRRELNGLFLASAVPALPPVRASSANSPLLRGLTENLAPLNYLGEAGPAGFSVELLRGMAREAQLRLEIEVQPWVRAVRAAAEMRDSVLFSLARLPERESQYQWVGPISERRILIYRLSKRSELNFTGLNQLQGSRLGVVRESAAGKQLLALGLKPDEEMEWAQDDASNLRKLLASRMEYLVMLDWAAAWQLRQHKLPYSALTPVFELDTRLAYWYGLHPNADPLIRQRLQAALDTLKRDGRYAKLRRQYFED